jgi:hypothetical protein
MFQTPSPPFFRTILRDQIHQNRKGKCETEVARARERRAGRAVVCNRFADDGGTLIGKAGQEAPEFGDRLRNPGDLAKNRISVYRHSFENFSEKSINSMLFQAISPPLGS